MPIELAAAVRPGDGIVVGQACAEPQTLVEALVAQRAALSGCSLFLGTGYSGILQPAHADHLRLSAYCGTGRNRALAGMSVDSEAICWSSARCLAFSSDITSAGTS